MLRSFAAIVFAILPFPLGLAGLAAILNELLDWELALGVGGSRIEVPKDMAFGAVLVALAVILFFLDRHAAQIREFVARHRTKVLVGAAVGLVGLVIGGQQLFVALDGGPAISAAMDGDDETLTELFAAGEVDARDHEPMMLWAAQRGHVDTIRLLLQHGVSPDAKRHDGLPALEAACAWGGAAAVTALKEAGATGDCP